MINNNSSAEEALIEAINKQTKILQTLTRPYVIVDVFPKRVINMLYFRVRNTGKTPAFKIFVAPTDEIPFRKGNSSDILFFQNPITALGPGDEISFFYNSAIELFSKVNPILKFSVEVKYQDIEEQHYSNIFNINIEMLKGLSLDLVVNDRIERTLEQIQKEIEKISRSVDRFVQYQEEKDIKKKQPKKTVIKASK